MSAVLQTGVIKLRSRIFSALEDVKAARRALREARAGDAPSALEIDGAVQNLTAMNSRANALVEAWEIVTGEVWGEAWWRKTGSTRA